MAETPDPIALLLERLGRLMVNDGHHQGLRPVQWEVLRYLARANRFSRTPTALTTYLGSTKGTVSQTLMALQRKGWVRKQPLAADKRSIELELTAAGQELLREDPLTHIGASIGAAGAQDRASLETALRRILTRHLAANGGRPFGLCRTCRHFAADDPDGEPHRCRLLRLPLAPEEAEQICVEQES